MDSVPQLVESLESLKKVVSDSPEILDCLRLMKECRSEVVLTPVKADKLIGQKEVSEILGVSANRVSDYVKSGLLTAYYTPPASHRKFWLSEVMKLPRAYSPSE